MIASATRSPHARPLHDTRTPPASISAEGASYGTACAAEDSVQRYGFGARHKGASVSHPAPRRRHARDFWYFAHCQSVRTAVVTLSLSPTPVALDGAALLAGGEVEPASSVDEARGCCGCPPGPDAAADSVSDDSLPPAPLLSAVMSGPHGGRRMFAIRSWRSGMYLCREGTCEDGSM